MAPVWDAAALAPAALLPDLMITTGFLHVTFFAILRNSRPSFNVFKIDEDDFGFFIMKQVVEYVGFGDVAFVSEADEFANTHLAPSQIVQGGDAEGSALRNHGNVAGHGSWRCNNFLACCENFGFGQETGCRCLFLSSKRLGSWVLKRGFRPSLQWQPLGLRVLCFQLL